jgi:hypothetical protein
MSTTRQSVVLSAAPDPAPLEVLAWQARQVPAESAATRTEKVFGGHASHIYTTVKHPYNLRSRTKNEENTVSEPKAGTRHPVSNPPPGAALTPQKSIIDAILEFDITNPKAAPKSNVKPVGNANGLPPPPPPPPGGGPPPPPLPPGGGPPHPPGGGTKAPPKMPERFKYEFVDDKLDIHDDFKYFNELKRYVEHFKDINNNATPSTTPSDGVGNLREMKVVKESDLIKIEIGSLLLKNVIRLMSMLMITGQRQK